MSYESTMMGVPRLVPPPWAKQIFVNVLSPEYTSPADASPYAFNLTPAILDAVGGILFFPAATYSIALDTVIPSTVAVMFAPGAMLNVAAGKTFTVNGQVLAGLDQWISGAGTVVFGSKVPFVYAQWWGGKADGTADATGAIQAALAAASRVVVTAGTWRVDGTILINQLQYVRLLDKAILVRQSARSVSTRPVVILQGDYAQLTGDVGAIVQSQNASPDGVVLVGREAPLNTAAPLAIRWFGVSGGFSIIGAASAATNKGLALQSTEAYGFGALYDGHFDNLRFFSVGDAIYCSSQANGNTFRLINCWDVVRAINFAGDSEGPAQTISDNNVSDVFVDGSGNLAVIVRLRRCLHSCFTNINGEPGNGTARHHDVDAASSRIFLTGADNCSQASFWLAALSTKIINGVTVSDSLSIGGVATIAQLQSTTRLVGGRVFEWVKDLGAVAGSGGSVSFDVDVGNTFPAGYWLDVIVAANHGGFGNQNSVKQTKFLFLLFNSALNQNVSLAGDSAGFAPANITITIAAVASSNLVRITIANANAAVMTGTMYAKLVGLGAAIPVPQ